MKPIDFSCILRLAKSQLMENGFKDATIEKLYGLLLEYMANQSHSMAFPDITLLAVIQVGRNRADSQWSPICKNCRPHSDF